MGDYKRESVARTSCYCYESVLVTARVFFWPRELHCAALAAFYRRMERGFVPSPGLSESPRRTR
jgi:hypothetical protein